MNHGTEEREGMELVGHDIVCFANDWDSDPLSKKHVMTRLARHNRVLWVNSLGVRNPTASARDFRRAAGKVGDFLRGCRKVADNLWVWSPLVIPFHGNAAARRFNRAWLAGTLKLTMRRLGMTKPITWTFLPSSADVVGSLGERLVVYQCVDEYSQFTGTDAAAILEMEARLARRSDVVLVSAQPLFDSKRRHNPKTFLVTHGVEVEHFRRALDPDLEVPADVQALARAPAGAGPVIGFFGLVADWVDLDLVRYLAEARPDWRLVLIGKSDTDTSILNGLPNVHLLGQRRYQDLPGYCKAFDVAILPFRINELTLAANPLKLREYLAAGLPVVSTAIPEAERLAPHVRVGRDRGAFLRHVEAALEEGGGPRPEISAAMDTESWDHKVEEMTRIVLRHLAPERGPERASERAEPPAESPEAWREATS